MSYLTKLSLEIASDLDQLKLANKSSSRQYVILLQTNGLTVEAAEASIQHILLGGREGCGLSTVSTRIGRAVSNLLDIEIPDNRSLVRLGGVMLDVLAKRNLIKAELQETISKSGEKKSVWMIKFTNTEFRNSAADRDDAKCYANQGYKEWTHPTTYFNDAKLDIVMKARKCNILHKFRKDQMPTVYDALNKLGRTEWVINQDMFELLSNNIDNPIAPKKHTDDELSSVKKKLSKINRSALFVHELIFDNLVVKGASDVDANNYASYRVNEYVQEKHDEYKRDTTVDLDKEIKAWSRRRDYEATLRLAESVQHDTLNFLYRCDSRGRIYVFNSHYLNPQNSDVAKSLLSFANPKPVSVYDLAVTIANHGGVDKESYGDRTKWVDDNQDYILEVGSNPFGELSVNWLIETGIAADKKARFQFIAACMEWVKLNDWIDAGNNPDEFLCSVPVAYDSTNSGLQILSIIGRDEYIAPYVNICPTEKPGDVYQLIGQAVAAKEPSPTLKEHFPLGDKSWRKIVKRNVMTKSYDARRFGMGMQQIADRPESNPEKNSAAVEAWANLDRKECVKVGACVYDTCSEYLQRGHELMEACKQAASLNDNPLITWRLPSGFTAFQYKELQDEDSPIQMKVGEVKTQVRIYKPTGKGNKRKHSSAIAPDMVHSIDAWLLTMVVNGLPADANLAFVHDAFGSDSIYGGSVGDVARDAYYTISDREIFALLLKQVADGQDVELPEAGSFNPSRILEADYIVC